MLENKKLINVDISIYTSAIERNLSDGYFIESTVVHIFYNKVSVFYTSNDTHMTIVPIITFS